MGKALAACEAKLRKYFDVSTAESIWYYIAMGAPSFNFNFSRTITPPSRPLIITIPCFTVTDPRFKMSVFDNNPDLFPSDWLDRCKKQLILMLKQYGDNSSSSQPATATPAAAKAANDDDDDDDDLYNDPSIVGVISVPESNSATSTVEEEIRDWLAAPRYCPPKTNKSPLPEWRRLEKKFPRLGRCARDALAIPGQFEFYTYSCRPHTDVGIW